MKKLIAAVTTAGLLVAGTAGMAQAAETPSEKAPAKVADGRGRRVLGGLKVAATTIGIEPKELGAALKDGQSIAEVATSHDVEPQAVIDELVTATNKKVDDAVAAGKLDADRAATIKDRAPERIGKLVNGKVTEETKHRIKRTKVRRHARRGAVVLAAEVIGVEPNALAEAVRDGQSIADVATSHDVEPQAVIDELVTATNKKVDDAVAAGKLDADRAATIKDRAPERIGKLVNATPRDHQTPTS